MVFFAGRLKRIGGGVHAAAVDGSDNVAREPAEAQANDETGEILFQVDHPPATPADAWPDVQDESDEFGVELFSQGVEPVFRAAPPGSRRDSRRSRRDRKSARTNGAGRPLAASSVN